MIKPGERENLWGYAKRLRFVRQAIEEAFAGRAAGSLRVLDVGCGTGALVLTARDSWSVGVTVGVGDGVGTTTIGPSPSRQAAAKSSFSARKFVPA